MTGSERPADFDAFWDAAIRKLEAEVAADPVIERLDAYCHDKHESFRVSFATFDKQRVYGFLNAPKGKGDGPSPRTPMCREQVGALPAPVRVWRITVSA